MGILGISNELLLLIGEDLSIKDLYHFLSTCRRLSHPLTPLLYKHGVQDVGELTALQWAAERGHATLAEGAILRGAEKDKPNQRQSSQTPLHSAARFNHPDVIRILVKHGARISAEDSDHMTPLHLAASYGGAEACRALLELGAEMMCGNKFTDTPAFLAARRGCVGCMEAFIAAGFDLNTRGYSGETILHAAAFGKREMVGYLLGRKGAGMLINAQDSSRSTPLHLVRNPRDLRLLLRHGADMGVKDEYGNTPAHNAASRWNFRCMRAFIDAGFDLHTEGNLGHTVLHRAVNYRMGAVVEYLLRYGGGGIIINAQDSQGETPLVLAACSDFETEYIINLLVKHGADLEMKDRYGITCAETIRQRPEYCETDPDSETSSEYASDSEYED